MSNPSDPVRAVFAVSNTVLAIASLAGVFGALSVRYWVVDVVASLHAGLQLVSAYGLYRRTAWDLRVLRISALCELGLGLITVAALVLGVVYLGGIHGEIGRTAFIIAVVGTALLVPYFFIYPSLQLLWIRRESHAR